MPLIRKYLPHISIALAVILPLLMAGYTLTFDMVWGPHFQSISSELNYGPFFSLLNTLSLITSGWIVQKIILLSIVFGASFGMYKFVETVLSPRVPSTILLLASLLYIFNPFFYTRFISGQWLVLIGYALLPWAMRSFYMFVKSPSFKTAWPVAAWTSAIGLTSIHTIGIAALAFFALMIYGGRNEWKKKLKWLAAITGTFLLLNLTWLAPLITNQSNVSEDIKGFPRSEMQAFATHGTILDSPPISAALLTGFWADDTNRYILPSQLPVWWIGVFIIMTMVITGIVQVIKRRDKLGYTFISLGVISWLLGIGIAWNVSAPLTELLTHIVPYYNGYREPHKWLMLLTLVYVYLAAIGAQWLYTQIARYKSIWLNYGFATLLFVSPFLFAPTLAWGAAGQLKSVEYPQQWQEAKTYLNTNSDKNTHVLVLPWHMYLPISFVGRVVGNPSGYYFDQMMITGNNFELKGVQDQRQTPLTKYVNSTLLTPSSFPKEGVSENLRKYNVDYVLLLKEADWQNYTWLNSQSKINAVVNNDKLILYKVER